MRSVLLTRRFLVPALFTTGLYFIVAGLGMNFDLLKDVWLGNYPLAFKTNLSMALIQGLFSTTGWLNVGLMATIALLTGANLGVLVCAWSRQGLKRNFWGAGAGSFLGMLTVGCFHCGLPLLSVVGLVGGLAILPLHGQEISMVAVGLLSLSFVYSIMQLERAQACAI